jgi:hypothetical protein
LGDFGAEDYEKFRTNITELATDCSLSPRDIDCSLYQMGRKNITLELGE